MEDRERLELEIAQIRQEREERKRAVWTALEKEGVLPEPDELEHFSNLLEEEITHAKKLWSELPAQVRRDLVLTLSRVADNRAVMDFTAVFRIAMRDPESDIRATAVESLNEVEDVRLVSEFVELLHHDPVARVREAAARSLGNFVLLGELEKIRPAPFQATVTALRSSYINLNEDPDVRRHAMESLAYTGEQDVPEMIAFSYAAGDADMRRSAVVAMGRSADKRWGSTVRRELRNPDPAMRLDATRASGELQLRAAAAEVVELAEDADARIRATALWALGQMGGRLARKTLQRYINAEDPVLSEVAEQALQELEFFYGDLTSFFGPPSEYDGETEELWQMPSVSDLEDEDEDDEIDEDEDDDSESEYEDEDGFLYPLDDDDDDDDAFEDDADRFLDLTLLEAMDDGDDDDEEWN